jgi:hypothetical protein
LAQASGGLFMSAGCRGSGTCNVERVVIERWRVGDEACSLVGTAILVDRARLNGQIRWEDGTAGG